MKVISMSKKDPESGKRKNVEHDVFEHGKVSFMASETMEQINQLKVKGICMYRFKGDIVTSGLDYATLIVGQQLTIGDAVFIVKQIGKPCHQQACNIYNVSNPCLLQSGVMFADVTTSGNVNVGDNVL